MSKSKAIISVIIASVLFGLFPSIQKLILANGTPPLVLVVCCNGVACLVGLAASIFRHRSLKLTRRQVPAIILVGFCGLFLTDYLLDIAYTLIPVGYVTMLHFMYPSLVCLFMALLFHERITKWKTLAIISSVIGLALLAGGGFSGSMAGIGIAVITSFTYVFYMIASDKTAARQIPVEVRLFYSNLVVTIAAGIFVIVSSGKTPLVFPKDGHRADSDRGMHARHGNSPAQCRPCNPWRCHNLIYQYDRAGRQSCDQLCCLSLQYNGSSSNGLRLYPLLSRVYDYKRRSCILAPIFCHLPSFC